MDVSNPVQLGKKVLAHRQTQVDATLRCSYLQLSGQTSQNQPSGDHPLLH